MGVYSNVFISIVEVVVVIQYSKYLVFPFFHRDSRLRIDKYQLRK